MKHILFGVLSGFWLGCLIADMVTRKPWRDIITDVGMFTISTALLIDATYPFMS